MLKHPVPSVSTDGWIQDTPTAVHALLAYYVTTDAAQTQFFRHDIYSLTTDGQITGLKSLGFADRLQEQLKSYLGRYFSELTVDVYDADELSPASVRTLKVDIVIQNEPISMAIDLNNGRFGAIHRLSMGL